MSASWVSKMEKLPDESTTECVQLSSRNDNVTWNHNGCTEDTKDLSLLPHGLVTLPRGTSLWSTIPVEHPTTVSGATAVVTQTLDLTQDIPVGVAVIQPRLTETNITVDQNQPHLIMEKLRSVETVDLPSNSIDTSKPLFYGRYIGSGEPNGLTVKCETRFYHAAFEGDDDCTCTYDGGFNHVDCDIFTQSDDVNFNLTVLSDIHSQQLHNFNAVTVENDVEVAIPLRVNVFEVNGRNVTVKEGITTQKTTLVSPQTHLTFVGSSFVTTSLNVTNPHQRETRLCSQYQGSRLYLFKKQTSSTATVCCSQRWRRGLNCRFHLQCTSSFQMAESLFTTGTFCYARLVTT